MDCETVAVLTRPLAVTRVPRRVPSPSRSTAAASASDASVTVSLQMPGKQTSFSTRGVPKVRSTSTPSSPSTGVGESRMIAAVCAGKRRTYSCATCVP